MIFTTFNHKYQLAIFLSLTIKQLDFIAHSKKANRYKHIQVPKKDGGLRDLYAPNKMLKEIQVKILEELKKIYKPRGCAFAYVKGRNIKDHAQKHQDKKWVLRVDLKDYFPSINFGRVRGIFVHLGCCDEIATYLAQLCCHEGKLPQGACTSPLLSNLIASKMDSELSKLAKENHCFYTRYCDDLYFSTNRKNFPQSLAFFDINSGDKFCKVGINLKDIIDKNDFIVNDKKVYLSDKSNRQFVTGLVINEKVNVNRKFIRNIRPIIKKLKINPNFKDEYQLENQKNILSQLRGKIEFIGHVRGYDDVIYRKYSLELSKLDSSFIFNKRNLNFGDGKLVEIYCEGKTDYMILKTILNYYKSIGRFNELEINFKDDSNFKGGDTELLEAYKANLAMASNGHKFLRIFIFDKDNQKVIDYFSKQQETLVDLKYLFLAAPDGFDKYCIENLFEFSDIFNVRDNDGRRLYFRYEFNEKGFHKSEKLVFLNIKKQTLVADEDVLDIESQNSMALTKFNFASLITQYDLSKLNLIYFEKTFEEIVKMKNDFYL